MRKQKPVTRVESAAEDVVIARQMIEVWARRGDAEVHRAKVETELRTIAEAQARIATYEQQYAEAQGQVSHYQNVLKSVRTKHAVVKNTKAVRKITRLTKQVMKMRAQLLAAAEKDPSILQQLGQL
jgi:hypothetical protein